MENILDSSDSNSSSSSSSSKIILEVIKPKVEKTVKIKKERSKRVITNSKNWNFLETDLEPFNQKKWIVEEMERLHGSTNNNNNNSEITRFIQQQINNKIYGYKSQDLLKSKYDETKFVDYRKILEMMMASDMKCYYCHKLFLVIYEYVREPRQWTVERIDNKYGHNKDNIEIACLDCNLHRRTMYHERYVFTKNLNIVKMDK
jgi:hypothetical protein